MGKTNVYAMLAIVLSVGALKISANLLEKHLSGTSGATWFEAGCSSDDAQPGGADCTKVLASRYAYFPPKPADPEAHDRVPRVPAAFLGLVYYTLLPIWLIGIGTPSWSRRWLYLLPAIAVLLGLTGSGYFTYIMFTELQEWCPWCMVTHGLNLLIAGVVFLMRPTRPPPQHATENSTSAPSDATDPPMPHPTGRLLAITALALFLGAYGQLYRLGTKTWEQAARTLQTQTKQYEAALKRLVGDTAKLVRHWEHADQHQIPTRLNDAVRTGAEADQFAWNVFVFSDFECQSCRRTADRFETRIQPLFAGRLRIIYKHYPLHSDCNGSTKTKMHPHACDAAAMAEAARILAGNDGFFKAHDLLFGNQKLLKQGKFSAEDMARHLGLELAAFVRAMKSDAATKRVWEDVNDGAACGLRATPSVYVKGKHVNSLANKNMEFWDALADRFWREAGEPRPPSSRLEKAASPPRTHPGKPPHP